MANPSTDIPTNNEPDLFAKVGAAPEDDLFATPNDREANTQQ
jgi:hypothetical protein